ncbi:uncharacterized protein N7477_005568 [Penicillium maclennaniae]|uniref:uncharacterized protein n=1 Tax=Penicillium maclennaniae TaxID=1343394 RepID=UPI00253F6998|nr:uncharacterized protein N7477_005568 [Penicillium maclennaniae]KAJ5670205.1 hypothetical protein N7477_005568 [Penicillium maclennaniae]
MTSPWILQFFFLPLNCQCTRHTIDMDPDLAPESLFRPAKRRKFIRRRPGDSSNTTAGDLIADGNENDGAQPALRRRQSYSACGRFSAASRMGQDDSRRTAPGSAKDMDKETGQDMRDRFTGNSGQTVDVDRHMYERSLRCAGLGEMPTNKIRMAYIDSEMAKRYRRSPHLENTSLDRPSREPTGGQTVAGQLEREPASLGRLHEIDLGHETKLQNIARTEAATRQLVGNEDSLPRGEAASQSDRLGPSENASRKGKRRTSADIERDRLVEEVLRESKLDVYDEPDDEVPHDGQAADDRIAEQFRRDFMDAIEARRRMPKTRTTKTENTEVPKGPKLGGSRSARAAMREMQSKPGQK